MTFPYSKHQIPDKKNVFVAFIDVIGTREFAVNSARLYRERILEFQKALYYHQRFLSNDQNDAAVYVFSDCAFMYSRSAQALLDYLIEVRRYSYSRGNGADREPLFFKAAIVKGDFELTDVGRLTTAHKIRSAQRNLPVENSIVTGVSFSSKAVEVYLAHELSKAIGIWVSENAFDASIKTRLLSNLHFPSVRNDEPKAFTDVRLSEHELNDSVLMEIIRAFFKARIKSRKFEKYYVPIFCNWVQSIDIKKILVEAKKLLSKPGDSVRLPLLENGAGRILYLVGTGYFEDTFRTVRGLGYFYLTALSHIYKTFVIQSDENKGEMIKSGVEIPKPIDAIERYLLRLKRVENAISTMPDNLMTPVTKDFLLDRMTSLQR